MNWLWHWLREWLELPHDIGQLHARINVLEAWIKNMDAVLWDLERRAVAGGAPEAAPDYKALAAQIRSEMTAAKTAFPTKMEGLK